jgi:DNA-binding transcriptional regulator LsrR (DeoR family)
VIADIRTMSQDEVMALKERVINLHFDHGMDAKEIAEEIGFSWAWVERVLRRLQEQQIAAGLKERKA